MSGGRSAPPDRGERDAPDLTTDRFDNRPHTAAFIDSAPEGDMMKRRAVHGAGATFVAQLLKFVLKFGSAVTLGRLLDPAQFGIVAMVGPILAFVSTINDLGFAQAIVQRQNITRDQVSGLFWVNLLVSLLLAGVLMLAAPLIGWVYGEPRTVDITLVMAGTIVLGTLGIIPNALLARQMRFLWLSAIDIGSLLVSVGASIAFALDGFGYWSLVLGQIASTITALLAVFVVARWWPQRPRRHTQIGSLVRFGANLTGVNLATYFSMTADNIIVGAVAGKTALGLYERSYTLALQPLGQLMAPLGRVAVPLLSRLAQEPDRLRTTYLHMLRLGVILTAPAMIFCVIMSRSVILFLLGGKWAAAAPIFAWICFGGVFASIFSSTGWLFTAQDRTREQLKLSLATALISIASFALGIAWGATGVAAAAALSFVLVQTPLMLWGLTRAGCLSRPDLVRALWPMLIAGALAAAAVFLIRSRPFFGDLFVAPVLAYAVFAGVAILLPGGSELYAGLWRLGSSLRQRRTSS